MITQVQQRALFALREALRLCGAAQVVVQAQECNLGEFTQLEITLGDNYLYILKSFLSAENIDSILAEHPDV